MYRLRVCPTGEAACSYHADASAYPCHADESAYPCHTGESQYLKIAGQARNDLKKPAMT